jgi:hypothetical protein
MLELLVEVGLLVQAGQELADQPVGGFDVVGQRGVGIEGRHTIITREDRRCDREFSIEHAIGSA